MKKPIAAFANENISNAVTEGLNNFLRYFKRISFGLPNFEHMRLRILVASSQSTGFCQRTTLLKMVYLATQNIMKKWTMPIPKWSLVIQQLAIHFKGRLKLRLRFEEEKE